MGFATSSARFLPKPTSSSSMPCLALFLVFALTNVLRVCQTLSHTASPNIPAIPHNQAEAITDGINNIDEQRYSRQLMVYGRSAQTSISRGRVLVVLEDNSVSRSLADEVIKNIALSGVGMICVCGDDDNICPRLRLRGNISVKEFASGFNPKMTVSHLNQNMNEMYDMSVFNTG